MKKYRLDAWYPSGRFYIAEIDNLNGDFYRVMDGDSFLDIFQKMLPEHPMRVHQEHKKYFIVQIHVGDGWQDMYKFFDLESGDGHYKPYMGTSFDDEWELYHSDARDLSFL